MWSWKAFGYIKDIFFLSVKMRLSVVIFSVSHNLTYPHPLRLKSFSRKFSSVRFTQWYDCFKI